MTIRDKVGKGLAGLVLVGSSLLNGCMIDPQTGKRKPDGAALLFGMAGAYGTHKGSRAVAYAGEAGLSYQRQQNAALTGRSEVNIFNNGNGNNRIIDNSVPIDKSGNEITNPLFIYEVDEALSPYKRNGFGDGSLVVYPDRLYFESEIGGWFNLPKSCIMSVRYDKNLFNNWIKINYFDNPHKRIASLDLPGRTEFEAFQKIKSWIVEE